MASEVCIVLECVFLISLCRGRGVVASTIGGKPWNRYLSYE